MCTDLPVKGASKVLRMTDLQITNFILEKDET